jgi:hypothetical protein
MPAARALKVASPPSSPKTVTISTSPAKALKEAAVASAAKPKGKAVAAKATAVAKTETVVVAPASTEKATTKTTAKAEKPSVKKASSKTASSSEEKKEKPSSNKKEGEKTFTVSSNETTSRTGGRYISKTAKAAALKAARQLFIHESAANLKGKSSKIHFTLKETTKGSDHSEHKYEALRVEKDKPTEIERNGVKIVYRYDYSVTSV